MQEITLPIACNALSSWCHFCCRGKHLVVFFLSKHSFLENKLVHLGGLSFLLPITFEIAIWKTINAKIVNFASSLHANRRSLLVEPRV